MEHQSAQKNQQTLSPVTAHAHYWIQTVGGRETVEYGFTKRQSEKDRLERKRKIRVAYDY